MLKWVCHRQKYNTKFKRPLSSNCSVYFISSYLFLPFSYKISTELYYFNYFAWLLESDNWHTFSAFRRFRLIRYVLTRLGCCLSDEVDPRRRLYTDPPTTTFTQCTYTTHRTHRTDGDHETTPSSVDESKDLCDLVLSTAPSQNLSSSQTSIHWRPTIALGTNVRCREQWRKYGWSHRVENTTIPKKNLFVKNIPRTTVVNFFEWYKIITLFSIDI